MKAYLIIDLDIVDPELFMTYVQRIPALIDKHQGHYLVQGVEATSIQARPDERVPQRTVVLEFPSRSHAESFLSERNNSDLHEIWAGSTNSRILLADGCR